jgi:hypothetical protein
VNANIQRTGAYGTNDTILFDLPAAQRSGNQQTFQVLVDGVVVATVTPSGSNFAPDIISPIALTAGSHTFEFVGLNPQGGDNTAFLGPVTIYQPVTLLDPLQDNGGPTQTMAPVLGGPAIDAGDNSLVPASVTTDQRGFQRSVNGKVDAGAYQSGALPVPVTTITAPPVTLGATAAVTVTVASPSHQTPSGTVTLTVDGTAVGQQSLTNGQAFFALPGLGTGAHALTANFTDSTTHFAPSTATGTLQVSPAPVTPALVPGSVSNSAAPVPQGVFLAGVAPQGTPALGPIVVFNDLVYFGRKAFQLRDRHGHTLRLRLQVLYLPTGQTVVVLGGTGGLNWHDLVAGKCVLTIDGRQVFDCFGRGPLGGVQKLRSFPVLSDPSALGALAAALGLPSPA